MGELANARPSKTSRLCMFVQTHPGNAAMNDHNMPNEKKADPVLPKSVA